MGTLEGKLWDEIGEVMKLYHAGTRTRRETIFDLSGVIHQWPYGTAELIFELIEILNSSVRF